MESRAHRVIDTDVQLAAVDMRNNKSHPPGMAPKKAKRGRPVALAPDMTERFMVRCTPGDLERWRLKAAELGLTTGQWLRMLAHQAEQR